MAAITHSWLLSMINFTADVSMPKLASLARVETSDAGAGPERALAGDAAQPSRAARSGASQRAYRPAASAAQGLSTAGQPAETTRTSAGDDSTACGADAAAAADLAIHRTRSIQKRARPADPTPSMSAGTDLVTSQSRRGHCLESQQQQSAAAGPRSSARRCADGADRLAQEAPAQAAALGNAAGLLGSVVFSVYTPVASKGIQRLPTQQARAAFPDYGRKPSKVSVPALKRPFEVNLGFGSDNRFLLGAGWPVLQARAKLRHGDLLRLSRTGDATFKLELGLNAAAMASGAAQEALSIDSHCSVHPLLW